MAVTASARLTRRCVAAALLAAGALTPVAVPAEAGVFAPVPLAHRSTVYYAAPPTLARCRHQLGIACYSPYQLQSAYDMHSLYKHGLTGRGRTIVVVDPFGSPTIAHDLKVFDRVFGLPAPPSFTVIRPAGPVPPFDPGDGARLDWAFETTLDVEYAHAMAPGANILLVETPVAETQGVAGFPEIVAAENYVIDHHLGDVISQSFGATERTFPSRAALLRLRSAYVNAHRHGVTVLAASGDYGASGPSNKTNTRFFLHRVSTWPSSDPLVTSVGGTQMHLDANGHRVGPDVVWNDTNRFGALAAGGGGRSGVFARPAYQDRVTGVVGDRRGTPDISLSASVDGGAIIYASFEHEQEGYFVIGGTSEATPLFAGIVAIADQAAHSDLGLLNPALYALGDSPALRDVTSGDNTATFRQDGRKRTVPGYSAADGYDLASGLGTVRGARLVRALAG